MYGIDIAHAQLISAGYRYEFADNRYAKVTIFIGQSDGRSDYRCITSNYYTHPQVQMLVKMHPGPLNLPPPHGSIIHPILI